MDKNSYFEILNDTKIINRALARTNVCVEALKKRVGELVLDENYLGNNYGKEILLILQNYFIQKYHKKYSLYTKEAVQDERLFFYIYCNGNHCEVAGVLDMHKGKYYLSESIIKSGDIYSGIISYASNGFGKIENQILQKCSEVYKAQNENSEILLTLYQLVTVGNCLGFFNVIISSDELSNSEKFMMKELKKEKFLIKHNKRMLYIHKLNGQLMLSLNERIDFKDWCNYDIGKGLEYIININ